MDRIPEWTLADKLRKARISAGLDQAQLADRLGAARNTVVNYENGRTDPKLYLIREWARVTEVPVEWFTRQVTGERLAALAARVLCWPLRTAS